MVSEHTGEVVNVDVPDCRSESLMTANLACPYSALRAP
jgi:hypothetical protein